MVRRIPFPMANASGNQNFFERAAHGWQGANKGVGEGTTMARSRGLAGPKKIVAASGRAGIIASRIEYPTTLMLRHVQSQGLLTEGEQHGIC
jgi:hypothetical protein